MIKKKLKLKMFFVGCPHRVNDATLKQAQEKWAPVFENLPRPLTAVLVGGAIKNKPFSKENAKQLAQDILNVYKKVGGSILITTSRRTGKVAEDIIMDAIKDIPTYTFLWGEKKENPIMGFYACSDRIIVTGDSVSMTCEACGTGKPVLIFEGKYWLTKKHLSFVKSVIDNKYAIRIDDNSAINSIPQKKLLTSKDVAEKIEKLVLV